MKLPVKQKALLTTLFVLISATLASLLLVLIITNGLFIYIAYLMIGCGMFGLVSLIYELNLNKYLQEEKAKKY
jgi:hypothetical protein